MASGAIAPSEVVDGKLAMSGSLRQPDLRGCEIASSSLPRRLRLLATTVNSSPRNDMGKGMHHAVKEALNKSELQNVVIPAKAGIQRFNLLLDASLRWHDGYVT
ncbi:MAG: hypothetical protein AAB325_17660 [Pseudomonadota bacterium]